MNKWNFKLKHGTVYIKHYKYKILAYIIKYVYDLQGKKHKTLMKETKEEFNKWRGIPCSQLGRPNIVKMLVLLNLIYRFNIIPASCFVDIGKLILKFIYIEKESSNNIKGEKQSQRTDTILVQELL